MTGGAACGALGEDAGASLCEDAPTMSDEKEREQSGELTVEQGKMIARKLQRKLELLATVTLLTTTAVLRVLEQRRPGATLNPEEWEKLRSLRADVQSAIDAIDDQIADEGDRDEEGGEEVLEVVDLDGVRDRLVAIRARIDAWPRPEGPPS